MVSFKTLAGTALAAVAPASAYITGISAPETLTAGSEASITVHTSIYIQNWSDYVIVWGLAPRSMSCGNVVCVGSQIDYTTIYPEQPALNNFTATINIPTSYSGDWKLVAAVPYLVGASGIIDVNAFEANVTIA